MLLIPHSFQHSEFKELKKHITISDLIEMTKKVKKGLGATVLKDCSGKYFKIRYSTNTTTLRALFLLQTPSGHIIPLLLRTKKDKVGYNMSFKNPDFCKALEKSLSKITEDLLLQKFEYIKI